MGNTSSKVKNRYNSKVYDKITVQLKKDLVCRFEEKLAQEGETKAGFFRKAIQAYLGDPPD
jgi:metal-responsive CopG/Arc/MetJ family transcriptional regulator